MKHYIGVDIGGSKCAVVLGKEDELSNKIEVIEKFRFNTPKNKPYETLDTISEKISVFLNDVHICGIGISCGGPLDSEKGIILSPPNLPGWDNIEIKQYFINRFHLPIYLQNDANACAVAEWKYGAGIGSSNLIFITFGTGLGAGLILNNQLYCGSNDMAGEIGHVRLCKSGPVGYGKAGSFEGFCSGGGIERLAKIRINEKSSQNLIDYVGGIDNITAKCIAELADQGDEFCKSIYKESGVMLGHGLSILIDILNPQLIIIGSIFARSHNLLWEYADKIIKEGSMLKFRTG